MFPAGPLRQSVPSTYHNTDIAIIIGDFRKEFIKGLRYNQNKKNISIIWFMPFIFFLFDCAAPIDYFGNSVNLKSDRIYLIKMRKDRNDKDKYTLIFVEQRGNHSKLTNKKREKIEKK